MADSTGRGKSTKLIIILTSLFLLSGCETNPSTELSAGYRGTLYFMGGTSYLARSEEDMVKLEVALNNRDSSSIKTMLSENRIFEIRSATEVQVLEVMDGYARVRVMSGDQAKESGWTFKDWVRP